MLSKTICLRISHIGKPVWNMHHGPCGLLREGCDAETHINMIWKQNSHSCVPHSLDCPRNMPKPLCPAAISLSQTQLCTGSSWGCSLKFIGALRGSESVAVAQWPQTAEISAELQIFSPEGYHITSVLSISTFKLCIPVP